MRKQVEIIKAIPSANVGDVFEVSDSGFIEVSQFGIVYLISEGWVKEVKEENLETQFKKEYNNIHGFDSTCVLFAKKANKHYLRIFDDTIKEWKKTTWEGQEITLDKFIRDRIEKG